jgi:hypothetical protein
LHTCRLLTVLSGDCARAYGGRFAPVGTRAVYLSATDSGASKEVAARKSRLGGVGQISTDKYPRVVYAVAVDLKKALSLTTLGSSQAAEARFPIALYLAAAGGVISSFTDAEFEPLNCKYTGIEAGSRKVTVLKIIEHCVCISKLGEASRFPAPTKSIQTNRSAETRQSPLGKTPKESKPARRFDSAWFCAGGRTKWTLDCGNNATPSAFEAGTLGASGATDAALTAKGGPAIKFISDFRSVAYWSHPPCICAIGRL